jgi:hypothetical protein
MSGVPVQSRASRAAGAAPTSTYRQPDDMRTGDWESFDRNGPEGLLRLEPGHSTSIALEFSDCDANARVSPDEQRYEPPRRP